MAVCEQNYGRVGLWVWSDELCAKLVLTLVIVANKWGQTFLTPCHAGSLCILITAFQKSINILHGSIATTLVGVYTHSIPDDLQ